MTIREIKDLIGAEVLCCEQNLDRDAYSACGCDLMSDVLAYVKDQAVLLTGLVNPQVVRTAEMMDTSCSTERHPKNTAILVFIKKTSIQIIIR